MFPVRNPNPTSIRPVITIGLIITCTLIFLWELSLAPRETIQAIYQFALTPILFLHRTNLTHDSLPVETTVITAMFFHTGALHLAGNMLFLWIFGKSIEDASGHLRFFLFYILCGAIAMLTYVLLNPDSPRPMMGASGAISAILGAYLRLFPHSRIVVISLRGIYPSLARVPAEWVLIFWYVLQLLYGLFTDAEQKTVAWEVHLSGFAAGILLIPLYYHTSRRP